MGLLSPFTFAIISTSESLIRTVPRSGLIVAHNE